MAMRKTKPSPRGDSAAVRALGYVRCSTEEQTRGDYNTLESQRDYITAYVQAVHPDWQILRFYEDGGYSGKDTNRPALQALLADCERGKFEVVITYKLDRITRSLADFFDLDRLFLDHGVSFISVKEQFDTSSPMGRAMRNIALTFAELEREMVAERVKDKMVAQVRQGRWPGGNVPFGYDAKDGKLVVNEVEADVVRMMFEEYLRTKSLGAVRDKVIALGVGTKRVRFRDGRERNLAHDWSRQKVSYILRNRVYLRELNYDGIRVPGSHPPVVDAESFALAQGVLAEHRRRHRLTTAHDYFLAGKVYCQDCGCRMTPRSTNHPGRSVAETPYYECIRTCKYRGINCGVRRINADVLERVFRETVSRLAENVELLRAAAAESAEPPQDLDRLQSEEALSPNARRTWRRG